MSDAYTVCKDVCAVVGAWFIASVAVMFGWGCWKRWVIYHDKGDV